MRIPFGPILVVLGLILAGVYLFNSPTSRKQTLGVPRVARLADLDGIETEVAIAPDGTHYAVIASGDLWLLDTSNGNTLQISKTSQKETFPSWTPDSRRLSFTRGTNTYVTSLENPGSSEMLMANATFLSWSPTSGIAFVREGALWLADEPGVNERRIVEADSNPDVAIRNPRFAPDSSRIAFIKSTLNLRGEVWTVNLPKGDQHAIVQDRPAENAMDVGWILGGQQLAYLTNRSGEFALWRVDFAEGAILPLTVNLTVEPLERIGMATWKDRIVVPRHFLDSDIVRTDGVPVVHTENLEFEPSVSRDGKFVAYTLEKDNRFEIWTAGID